MGDLEVNAEGEKVGVLLRNRATSLRGQEGSK